LVDSPDNPESGSVELSHLRAIMRFASFALPSLVTSIALLLCWRHFTARGAVWASLEIATAFWLARFLHRRSRGLPARFGFNNPGPDRDDGYNDQSDIGSLWAAAIYLGGTIFILIKGW
jgi:hypothetical protein